VYEPDLRIVTKREAEVLALLVHGADDMMIARELRISHRTVRVHVNALFAKLGVANRTQAAIIGFLSHLRTCTSCRARALDDGDNQYLVVVAENLKPDVGADRLGHDAGRRTLTPRATVSRTRPNQAEPGRTRPDQIAHRSTVRRQYARSEGRGSRGNSISRPEGPVSVAA
jgi:DNA-binding CsgD family transcriptional regulator